MLLYQDSMTIILHDTRRLAMLPITDQLIPYKICISCNLIQKRRQLIYFFIEMRRILKITIHDKYSRQIYYDSKYSLHRSTKCTTIFISCTHLLYLIQNDLLQNEISIPFYQNILEIIIQDITSSISRLYTFFIIYFRNKSSIKVFKKVVVKIRYTALYVPSFTWRGTCTRNENSIHASLEITIQHVQLFATLVTRISPSRITYTPSITGLNHVYMYLTTIPQFIGTSADIFIIVTSLLQPIMKQ